MKLNQTKLWLLIAISWMVLGLYFILSSFVYFADRSQSFNWESQLINRLPPFLVWAVFTPFIYKFIKTHSIDSKVFFERVKFLLTAGIIISIIHRLISVTISYLILLISGETSLDFISVLTESKFVILSYMFDSFFTYGFLISVIYSINYYKKFAEHRTRTIELEQQLNQAQLNALRMQLQPHFLFNTLNSISTLIHKNPEAADQMLTRLSDLLRFSLDTSNKQLIPLNQELEFISSYLEIQKVRYENRLQVAMEINENTLLFEVPALILQPLVENSIVHSVEKRNDMTVIRISSRVDKMNLVLEVEDNGSGIINNSIDGIGLSNTRSRLAQIYNNRAAFHFEIKPDKVLNRITIPLTEQ